MARPAASFVGRQPVTVAYLDWQAVQNKKAPKVLFCERCGVKFCALQFSPNNASNRSTSPRPRLAPGTNAQ